MIASLKELAILFTLIAIGFAIGKWKKIPIEKSNILSLFLVNVFLPCKVFLNFQKGISVTYIKENYLTLIVSSALVVIIVILSKLFSKSLTKDEHERNTFSYSLIISNYGSLGYVFVEALLGANALTDMIFFCIPIAFYSYSFGYAMLSGTGSTAKRMINPITASLLLGIIFGIFQIPLPDFVGSIISPISSCTGVVAMFFIGLVLSTFKFKELLPNKKTVAVAAARLIGIPLIVLGICKLLSLFWSVPSSIYPTAIIAAFLPCGMNTITFSAYAGKDCLSGAKLILLSYAFCLLTIPLWIWILNLT